jgi:multidrug efflux pump subunit AcrA (membrane-fusion protein)
MKVSEYLKPALGVVFVAALAVGYYWFEHRPRPDEKETPGQALVIVTKSTNACFSDMVRVTGFIVPRREAQVGVDQEGSRVTEVRTAVGAPASPQAGPMFRISVNNEIELEAEVPSVHLLKLNPGATVRISRDDAPDVVGKVRQILPQIDRTTQLGKIRISLNNNPSLKVGMFARANIDAKRSCGVAVPRTAIDRLTLQVVKGNTIETRKVRVGLTSETSTEILEGLDVGETVVADAGTSLHDGDQIKTMFADELERTRAR